MGEESFGGRLIAVGGGKGGVGKSVITANLGVALAQAGARVIILDADLGAPNLHSMFGIQLPGTTIEDFIDGRVKELSDALCDSGVPGLQLLCGTPQVLGSANPKWQSKLKLIRRMSKLDTDCLLIDVGAGVDLNTVDFFNAADIRLVVLTPEITSIQNAYGFLKISLYRRLQRAVAGRSSSQKLADAFGGRAFEIGSSMEKMDTFLTLVESEAPELAGPFHMLLEEFNAKLVGNMLVHDGDRNVVFAVQRMTQQFLGLRTDVAATFHMDPKARDAVNSGRPFMVSGDRSANVRMFAKLAKDLLAIDLDKIHALRRSIVQSLSGGGPALQFGLESIEVRPVESNPEKPPLPNAAQAAQATQATHAAKPAATHAAKPAATHAAKPAATQAVKPAGLPPPAPGGGAASPTVATDQTLMAGPDERQTMFLRELDHMMRSSERLTVSQYVQLNLGGHWHLGNLVEINEAGACLAGIRAGGDWMGKNGLLRLVARGVQVNSTPTVPVALYSSNTETGKLIIRFTEQEKSAPLVNFFRTRLIR